MKLSLNKVLGMVAIVGIGVWAYSKYKEAQRKNGTVKIKE